MSQNHKRTVSNTMLSKLGNDTIKSRHAMPLKIENLLKEQKEYSYTKPSEEFMARQAQSTKNVQQPQKEIVFPSIG